MSFDAAKLVKVLAMTTSNQDGEALNAVRLANKMIAKERLTWNDIFEQFAEKEPKPAPEPKPRRSDIGVEEMLSVCLENVKGKGKIFIESLNKFFDEKGFLTKKQESALRKFYDNVIRSKK